MDISVHCDIGIFEWLMRWVKKESLLEEDWPQLDCQCVIPVLVSAAFLKMEPLLEECLLFCHQHMNDILRTTTNLSCLNDTVLTRYKNCKATRNFQTYRLMVFSDWQLCTQMQRSKQLGIVKIRYNRVCSWNWFDLLWSRYQRAYVGTGARWPGCIVVGNVTNWSVHPLDEKYHAFHLQCDCNPMGVS